jgi:hypothetical protein
MRGGKRGRLCVCVCVCVCVCERERERERDREREPPPTSGERSKGAPGGQKRINQRECECGGVEDEVMDWNGRMEEDN